jgi:hypothetical protein
MAYMMTVSIGFASDLVRGAAADAAGHGHDGDPC